LTAADGRTLDREQLPFWIGFNRVPGIGVVGVRRLIDAFGDLRTAWEAPAGQLAAVGIQGKRLEALVRIRRQLDVTKELERTEAAGVTLVTIQDRAYPRRLLEIDGAPPILFVKGELRAEDDEAVAVVGTRHPTGYGRAVAERLAGDLARSGVTVVSGFARGIDSHAHRAALDAGGRTIAVFASGLDVVYPPENRPLVDRVVRQGALISEHPLGVRPEATNFPARNRIVSGLGRATLVIEAGERSGALLTARFAGEQGRDVMAVPGPITSPRSVGTNRLIQDGARLILSAEDVLSELGWRAVPLPPAQLGLGSLLPSTDVESALLEKLAEEALSADDLSRALGRSAQEISTALTMLELKGRIRQVAGLNYVIQR
jgi:DNA processing protein